MRNYCFVKKGGQILRLSFDMIRFVEACRNYCRIVLDDDDSILIPRSMKDIMDFLPPAEFMRIHKSYIVPINRIRWISGRELQLDCKQSLPIGEIFAANIHSLIAENML